MRILVADDVEAVRLTMVLEMRDRGWQVEEANGGEEALRRIRADGFDVLVTDIWMPQGDGLATIKAVRDAYPDMRVFAITGGGPGMTIETASTLAKVWGAERFFVKPFDVGELIAAIEGTAKIVPFARRDRSSPA